MNTLLKYLYTLFFAISVISCDTDFGKVVDFRNVENQNVIKEEIIGTKKSSLFWLRGMESQMSILLNRSVPLTELGSDNYVNISSKFNTVLDHLNIDINDPDINSLQYRIGRLRKMALYGYKEIGPKDEIYTKQTEAEYYFFEGMSYLYAGMYFSYLPQTVGGKPISSQENYNKAISLFKKAIALNPKAEYFLGLSRSNYLLGNKTEALDAATKAIQKDNKNIREAMYNLGGNYMASGVYIRRQRDLQPLPSLDFLDPKYSKDERGDRAPSIAYLKAEEAYLIIAEIAHSNNDLAGFKKALNDLLDLVASRKKVTVDDKGETRKVGKKIQRPNKSTVVVNGRNGLVLDRTSSTIIPAVSGTSLKKSDVASLNIDDESLEILYRTRQEIFMAEGMRFVDMGVKLVMSNAEISQNKNVKLGDKGTKAVIPPFIDAIKEDLDKYDYSEDTGIATTKHNVSKILVENKTSPLVLPFH